MELRSVADRELARLENDARLLGAALPRWSLLKANSSMLSGRNVIANSLINQVRFLKSVPTLGSVKLLIIITYLTCILVRNVYAGTFHVLLDINNIILGTYTKHFIRQVGNLRKLIKNTYLILNRL